MNRTDLLQTIKSNPDVSVLIVGAGINGIGAFRDLALNGVDVLIVDRADFCSGASAASSHMAHGGIRYLENGEFRLVREAVGERNRMIQNAPHIVKPLATAVPMFKHFSGLFNAPLKFLGMLDKPSERGSVIIKLGLMMYDAYTGKTRTVPRHKFRGRAESLNRWNRLNPEIVSTAEYYDGLIQNPERLALEVLLDGIADGGRAINYVSLVKGEGGLATLRDELTGATFDLRPKLVINASGPWIDAANKSLGQSTRFIGGTKGSHLVLDHSELRKAIGENEFFFENKDGRIVLIFPLFDKVLVGTSDIPVESPDNLLCTEDEVDYFLGMTARVFPDIKVGREHIVFRFTGIRPLAHTGSAKTTGQITRDHHIQVLEGEWTGLGFPVYSLVGGKWTSFRAFAEQVSDKVLGFLGKPRTKSTRELGVGGGHNYPRSAEERKRYLDGLAAWTGLSAERVQSLFARYGTRAESVAMFLSKQADEPLKSLPEYSRREIGFLCLHEYVVHLDDLVMRRTMLAMLGQLTRPALDELANVASDFLGWDAAQKKVEVTRALDLLASRHGVSL
ncbi:MAG: glycerol-3-phosphate dehydrogenase/oxidase [Chloroflexi bacterium]|nr:glycerol-3-phosphate dehydrogenase/oxidase [Chloroflexota bacterium]